MKKLLINYTIISAIFCISIKHSLASVANPSDLEMTGITTGFIIVSPTLATYGMGYTSSDYTRDKERKQNHKKQQMIKLAVDDAITYIATNGEQGKTVRFEAAAKEIRKEAQYKDATDLQVAKVILDLK